MEKYSMKKLKALLDNYVRKNTNKDILKYCDLIKRYLNKSYGSNNYVLNFQDLTIHSKKPDIVMTCLPQNWWIECINQIGLDNPVLKESSDAPNTIINYIKNGVICGNKSKTESNYQILKDFYCLQP